jgi:hypothetical protein
MAAVGAGTALGAASGARAAASPSDQPYKVVADLRLPQSRAFAHEARRAGHRIAWTEGDVTGLWYEELDLLWRGRKAALVGLTGPEAFFCLERLALDRGLRLVFKGEHGASGGLASHVLAGPSAVVTPAALASLSEGAWPAQTVHLALASVGAGGGRARLQAGALAGAARLVSWALAGRPL